MSEYTSEKEAEREGGREVGRKSKGDRCSLGALIKHNAVDQARALLRTCTVATAVVSSTLPPAERVRALRHHRAHSIQATASCAMIYRPMPPYTVRALWNFTTPYIAKLKKRLSINSEESVMTTRRYLLIDKQRHARRRSLPCAGKDGGAQDRTDTTIDDRRDIGQR